ncbi:MAG: Bro-N domain-containing protein [Candidatus Omnitrophica bacterium]|nr:Bro-N domain-containing protein [Candidatus Omnitrophota bacterium]
MKKEITTTKIAIFRKREIRKTIHKNEWWFVVNDVVSALTDSPNVQDYIKKMRKRDNELSKGWGQIVTPLSVKTAGGAQKLNCANTEGIFRIIQSIPSPKAEPFKRWLARVGYERIQEIEDPELATKRTRVLCKAKGYSEDWIEKRMRGIAIREELTDQWKKRRIKEQKEYEILTAEISKATFDMTPSAYKKHKGLKRENLRDHMTDLELIFSMLGEASTKEIAINKDAQGFVENKQAAFEGGAVAGNARKELERKSGKKVISKENYKKLPQNKKLLK